MAILIRLSHRFQIGMVILLSILFIQPPCFPITTRIKDTTRVVGLRSNPLIGYGIIVGLQGTGDTKGTLATIRSIVNLLENFGVRVNQSEMKGGNIAAVMITAKVESSALPGDALDIQVSSIGDATSLAGGTLLMAPLRAANGEIYAVAQGSVSLGGYAISSGQNLNQKGHPTVGTIPGGATIERPVDATLFRPDLQFSLSMLKPDFTTAVAIAKVIRDWNPNTQAKAINAKSIEVFIPKEFKDNEMGFIAKMEQLQFTPDQQAHILINERTGTVLMGGPIRIMPTAIAHGPLKIEIQEFNTVSQPEALTGANAKTVPITNTSLKVEEKAGNVITVAPGNTVDDVVHVLNKIGVKPRDLIIILQMMRSSGALQADLEII